MNPTAPAATLPDDARLPWPLTATALIAFTAIFITGDYWWGMPVLALLLLASHATPWRLWRNRFTRWGTRAAAFALVLFLVGIPRDRTDLWYFVPDYTNLVGYLLATELVVRAWQRPSPQRARESRAVVLFVSGMIVMAASNTYNRAPIQVIAPLFTLFAALSFRALAPAPHAPAPRPAPRNLLALRGIALGLALALGFTGVYSVTRYENRISSWAMQFLRQQRRAPSAAIGLTGAPRLRRTFNPAQSTNRVLRIEGPPGERHLRLLAFDSFANSEWQPSLLRRAFVPIDPAEVGGDLAGARLHVVRLGETFDLLALPADATAVQSTAPLARDDLDAFRFAESGATSYDVIVSPSPRQRLRLARPLQPAARDVFLALSPATDPKIIELAKRVAGGGDPATRVMRLQNHLRSNHAYSLSFQPDGDPLTDFILNRRAAHCQYFASAMAVMARAAGVPSRLVTGYYAHERAGDDQTIVRERDAHAWCECYIDGVGWVTVDATPAAGRPDGLFPDPPRWQQWWERVTDLPGRAWDWASNLPLAPVIGATVGAIVLGGGAWLARVLWLRRRRIRAARGAEYAPRDPRLTDAARRFDRLLRRRGIPCPPNRTWREHLATLPEPATALQNFVDLYDTARFGPFAESPITQLQDTLNRLERSAPPGGRGSARAAV